MTTIDIQFTTNRTKSKPISIDYMMKELISDIASSLEKHFEVKLIADRKITELTDNHFVKPPSKGEFYIFENRKFKVIEVCHYFHDRRPSYFIVKEVKNNLNEIYKY